MGKAYLPVLAAFNTKSQKDWDADVSRALAASHSVGEVQTVSFSADVGIFFYACNTTGGGFTATLPPVEGLIGKPYAFKNTGSNTLTLSAYAGDTIDGSASLAVSSGTTVWVVANGVTQWYQILAGTGGGSGAFIPTGTGFVHITSGTQDAAARAVDLSSADATGTIAGARFPTWTNWTPTITNAGGGGFTTTVQKARYIQYGKQIHYLIAFTVTAVGGGGYISFTNPVTGVNTEDGIATGTELTVGWIVTGYIKGATTQIWKWDGSIINTVNYKFVLTGMYEVP